MANLSSPGRFIVQRSAWHIARYTLVIRVLCGQVFHFSRDSAKSPNAGSAHCILRLSLGPVYDKASPNDLGRRESRLFYSCRNNRSRDCIAHAASVSADLYSPGVGTAADRPRASQYLREFRPVPESEGCKSPRVFPMWASIIYLYEMSQTYLYRLLWFLDQFGETLP